MINFGLGPLPTDSVEGGPRAQIDHFHRLTPSIWKYRSNESKKNFSFFVSFKNPIGLFKSILAIYWINLAVSYSMLAHNLHIKNNSIKMF